MSRDHLAVGGAVDGHSCGRYGWSSGLGVGGWGLGLGLGFSEVLLLSVIGTWVVGRGCFKVK